MNGINYPKIVTHAEAVIALICKTENFCVQNQNFLLQNDIRSKMKVIAVLLFAMPLRKKKCFTA